MPIDIEKLNPGCRFYYPGDSDGKEWVMFRLPNAKEQKAVDEDTVETVVEYVHPQTKKGKPDKRKPPYRIEYEQTIPGKEEEREQRMIDGCISDWNLCTPGGEPISCNKAVKVEIVQGMPDFNLWMNECLETLATDQAGQDKELEKN